MQKEIIEAEAGPDVRVLLVWMPMAPTDDEPSAREAGAELRRDTRVSQFYDGQRLIGRTCIQDVLPDCISQALASLPADHALRAALEEYAADPAGPQPLWDAVLFYPPGDEWQERLPAPQRWSKQVGFYGPAADGVTGVFWKNDCTKPPVESDWRDEIREGVSAVGGRRRGRRVA